MAHVVDAVFGNAAPPCRGTRGLQADLLARVHRRIMRASRCVHVDIARGGAARSCRWRAWPDAVEVLHGEGRARQVEVVGRSPTHVGVVLHGRCAYPPVEVDGAALRQQLEVDVVPDADVAASVRCRCRFRWWPWGRRRRWPRSYSCGAAEAASGCACSAQMNRTRGGSIGYASLWSRSAYGVSTSARGRSRDRRRIGAAVYRQPREEGRAVDRDSPKWGTCR